MSFTSKAPVALIAMGAIPALAHGQLPEVTSGTVAAHFVCDPSTMDLDASNAVTAWRAANDPSIQLDASGSGAPTNLLYVASDLSGHGGIQVNDFSGDSMGLSGSIGDLDLVESTIFWLGYYAPGRDGSTDDGSGQYVYNYFNGSSYISHQSDDGFVEHYSPTCRGDAIDSLEGEYQVWTSVTYGTSPGVEMFANGVDLNAVEFGGITSDGDPDTFHMFRYSSSGYNFVGNMHECIIYDGALSAADIAAVEAYLEAKLQPYDGLPEVTSGTLAAHFVCDPSTMDLDASSAVTAWRASNNSAIELTASGSGAATNLLYDAGDLYGQGGIQVNDFSGDTLALAGTLGDIDLIESTIFWLGYYAPGRDGSTDDGSGQYAYNYYNGSSYISHQSDDGFVEHYSPTCKGDAIDSLEGEYQVWTSVTYGASPGVELFVNGDDLNAEEFTGITADGDADTFQMFRYSSSGYNFVGNMHECIIYEGALSAGDIAVIEAYLDAKRTPPGPGTTYCFGDGSGTACPCGNAGSSSSGCANSAGSGGTLAASGAPSLSTDTLVLEADGLVAGLPCLFFSGANRVNGGAGIVFGDGLRCAGFQAVRIEVTASDAGGAASSSVEVSTNGQAYGHTLRSGETVNYQCWYRDDIASSPCGNSFNATNGYTVVWDA